MLTSPSGASRTRQALFQTLCDNALSPGAKEICLRGPKESGKTTLLRDFGAHLRENLADYPLALVVEWDLRQNTPLTDEEFRVQMGAKLADALSQSELERHQKIAALMRKDERNLKNLSAAFRLLEKPVAFLIDNHDAVLDAGEVSITVWSELNSFLEATAGLKKLRIFATSRVPLQELARGEEERSSPYFSRLQVEPVLPFDDADLLACLQPLVAKAITLDDSARQEILQWTGGAPVLVTRILDAIEFQRDASAEIWNDARINSLAEGLQERVENLLGGHWHRANVDLRSSFIALCEGQISVSQLTRLHRIELERRGWLWGEGLAAVPTRFIESYVSIFNAQSNQLPSLFGNENRWEANFPDLLQLRLQQVGCPDTDLQSLVKLAISELAAHPTRALGQMRDIVARALILVWEAELGDSKELPQGWINATNTPELPPGSGPQVRLLRDIMGTYRRPECLAQHITKPTYELINTLNGAGNYRNHSGGHSATFGFAAVLCLSAVELCAALKRDVP